MTNKPLNFQSSEERDKYFRENAEYFTYVAKTDVGKYERNESKTLEEAKRLAKDRSQITGRKFLIYAVIGAQSAYVCTID